jgi:hypothetical protein
MRTSTRTRYAIGSSRNAPHRRAQIRPLCRQRVDTTNDKARHSHGREPLRSPTSIRNGFGTDEVHALRAGTEGLKPASSTSESCPVRGSRLGGFAADSPLEQRRFELMVPPRTPEFRGRQGGTPPRGGCCQRISAISVVLSRPTRMVATSSRVRKSGRACSACASEATVPPSVGTVAANFQGRCDALEMRTFGAATAIYLWVGRRARSDRSLTR